MARILQSGQARTIRAIGVNQQTALLVDATGKGRVVGKGGCALHSAEETEGLRSRKASYLRSGPGIQSTRGRIRRRARMGWAEPQRDRLGACGAGHDDDQRRLTATGAAVSVGQISVETNLDRWSPKRFLSILLPTYTGRVEVWR